jgi:hypothetical protein
MIEIATFVRMRNGDLTTSGVFPGKTRGGGKMRKAITLMRAPSDRLIALPVFPGKKQGRVDQTRPGEPPARPPAGMVN